MCFFVPWVKKLATRYIFHLNVYVHIFFTNVKVFILISYVRLRLLLHIRLGSDIKLQNIRQSQALHLKTLRTSSSFHERKQMWVIYRCFQRSSSCCNFTVVWWGVLCLGWCPYAYQKRLTSSTLKFWDEKWIHVFIRTWIKNPQKIY